MKLVSLYASNFKNLDFDVPLRFKNGITVISGLNEAGKSTVLDAVLYALYARVTRPPGHAKDEDLLAYTTGRATVILEFSIGDKLYKVRREIRRNGTNKATLDLVLSEDRSKAIATKSREVTATILSLLDNISFDEMISSNIVAQKDLDRLVEKGADRWKVVNAFLHLESFSSVIESLNEEKKDIEGTGPSRPGFINVESQKLEQLRRELEEYRKKVGQNETLAGANRVLGEETEALTTKYAELNSLHGLLMKYDEAANKRQQIFDEAANKEKVLGGHKSSVSAIDVQVRETEAELSKYRDLPSETEIQGLSEVAGGIRTASSQMENLGKSIEKKKSEIRDAEEGLKGYNESDVRATKASHVSLKSYAGGTGIAFVAAAIAFFFSIPILPWILVGLGMILLVLLSLNVSRMNRLIGQQGLVAKFELLRGRRDELKQLEDSLFGEQTKQTVAMNDVARRLGDFVRYEQLGSGKEPLERAELVLKEYQDDAKKCRNVESSLGTLKVSLEKLRSQMDEVSMRQEIDELKTKATEIVLPSLPTGVEFSKGLLVTVGKDREDVSAKIAGKNATAQSNEKTITENNAFIEARKGIEEKVTAQQQVLSNLQHKLKVVIAAKDGVEKTAETRRAKFKPRVQFAMGEILPSLTSGRYKAVKLDDDFGVQVFDPEAGEYRPKDVFSGGAEDQFLLAMRLAFALALIPEVKGTTPQFLWLDEPLGSSDEVRRSGIIEYLSASLSRLFNQIFIVSHVGGLEEQIPTVIRLENGKPAS